ncbi:MAG: hypothetical protein WAL92_00245 [Thiogranum sp.]|jgi:hypothetical protein
MTHVEDIEIEKRRRKLDHDVRQLVDKYLKIVEWDVPESDEPRARKLIIGEIREALTRIEAQA